MSQELQDPEHRRAIKSPAAGMIVIRTYRYLSAFPYLSLFLSVSEIGPSEQMQGFAVIVTGWKQPRVHWRRTLVRVLSVTVAWTALCETWWRRYKRSDTIWSAPMRSAVHVARNRNLKRTRINDQR